MGKLWQVAIVSTGIPPLSMNHSSAPTAFLDRLIRREAPLWVPMKALQELIPELVALVEPRATWALTNGMFKFRKMRPKAVPSLFGSAREEG